MTDSDLTYIGAREAIKRFRSKDLSPREVLEAIIERAAATEPVVNAFTDTHFDDALRQADAAADAYAHGRARPLEGLAVAVKEEARIAGQSATDGSLLFADSVADATEPLGERILAAGGIVHARTATPEFSMASVTWTFLHGITRNPWNPAITCGGSSGGSGASLAAGTSTLATGSDIAGSIRIPAAMNGLVGFKPPWGRVPESWPWNREHYAASGPLGRSVDDVALFQNAISGPLGTDMFSLERLELPVPVPSGRGLRVALSRDLSYFEVDSEVVAAFDEAAETLVSAGIEVEEVDLGWTEQVLDTVMTHLKFQARSLLEAWIPDDADRSLLTPYVRAFLDEPPVSVVEWQQSWHYGDHMYAAMRDKVFDRGCHALICPTSASTDVPADLGHPESGTAAESLATLEPFMTYPFNILGRMPVISVPIGLAPMSGVPIGMQIVGPVNEDLVPFQVAATYEQATGDFFDQHRPPVVV